MSPLRDKRGQPLHKKVPQNTRKVIKKEKTGLIIVESHSKYISAK